MTSKTASNSQTKRPSKWNYFRVGAQVSIQNETEQNLVSGIALSSSYNRVIDLSRNNNESSNFICFKNVLHMASYLHKLCYPVNLF